MSPFDLLRELVKRGVRIQLDGSDNLIARGNETTVPADLLALMRARKPELVNYLKKLTTLKVGMLVTTPDGVGRVWEAYPSMGRCGVVFNRSTAPVFYDVRDLEVGNIYAKEMH